MKTKLQPLLVKENINKKTISLHFTNNIVKF